ncbi:hypothetical protein [Rhizobium leguminosarum]|uniref:Oxidoreductase n=1 Tax=Rhizobium leguminosarum TaxID=384 RepID=A0A2K9YX84_RHILE|nr:hypothetical protein [Rhizobium leguminosarum]AUW40584.1 conserved exported protein of unknown function [Rhizobium leguminosarum]
MSCKFIAISLLSIGLAGPALAQTAGGADANGRLSVAPIIGGSGSSAAGSAGAGSAGTGSVGGGATSTGPVGTDPGTTGSTTVNGGVDLNSGRSTINPGGVNPNLQPTPGCTGGSADTGSLSEACPQ